MMILSGAALLLMAAACATRDWKDASLTPADRAQSLLKEMTLEEKVGQMCQYVGPCYVPPGQGTAHGNVDADDENLGHPDMADKIRAGDYTVPAPKTLPAPSLTSGNSLSDFDKISDDDIPF